MKKSIKPRVVMARIIVDQRDGTKDKFIPYDDALAMEQKGELVQLDMGDAYPRAFGRTK